MPQKAKVQIPPNISSHLESSEHVNQLMIQWKLLNLNNLYVSTPFYDSPPFTNQRFFQKSGRPAG